MQTDLITPGCDLASAAFVQSRDVVVAPAAVAAEAHTDSPPPAVLTEDGPTHIAAAIALSTRLVGELRSYVSGCQAYNVDRPWILSECTILVASLLTLGLENRLCSSSARWARLVRFGRIQPVLLPISTDLCERRVSATRGLCLLTSADGHMMEHRTVEIYGADDLVAPVPDREAVRRLLGSLPATVPFPPYLQELFYRATCALEQHSVRGANLLDCPKVLEQTICPERVSQRVNHDHGSNSDYFDLRHEQDYSKDMGNRWNSRSNSRGKYAIKITDGVNLKVTPVRSAISSARLNDILIGRSPSQAKSINGSIDVEHKPKSPLSRRKMMEILMGRLPTPGDVD